MINHGEFHTAPARLASCLDSDQVDSQKADVPEITVVGGFIASAEYHGRFLP